MVSEIRAIDTLNRPISTGNSVPRPDAEHLRASYYKPHRDWSNDTQEQVLYCTTTMQQQQPRHV